jgi:antitoxin PrlF
MSRAVIRANGQITLPREIRDALHVDEGDDISFVVTDKGVLMHGVKMIPAEQAWFWSAQWQQGERDATADLEAGRTTKHPSSEDLLATLS